MEHYHTHPSGERVLLQPLLCQHWWTIAVFLIVSCDSPQIEPQSQVLESPTKSLLQAIDILDDKTAWVSGHDATFLRTEDGGRNWEYFQHPTGDSLQFRDIHAFSASRIILMSAGTGELSRIFSFDVPDQWEEHFVMKDSLGFLDCLDFWDSERGIAYGDAIDRFPYILLTADGGRTWQRADTTLMPKSGKGEGGFAASGTCVTVGDGGKAWIATGAGGNCRFLYTQDYGATWQEISSPLVTGEAAGNTSVTFVQNVGVVTGGDLLKSDEFTDNCAFSTDGGLSWNLSRKPITSGAFYGSALSVIKDDTIAFVCGPNGIDYTLDLGSTWNNLDTMSYWAVAIKEDFGYAVGTEGKILRISLQP